MKMERLKVWTGLCIAIVKIGKAYKHASRKLR